MSRSVLAGGERVEAEEAVDALVEAGELGERAGEELEEERAAALAVKAEREEQGVLAVPEERAARAALAAQVEQAEQVELRVVPEGERFRT